MTLQLASTLGVATFRQMSAAKRRVERHGGRPEVFKPINFGMKPSIATAADALGIFMLPLLMKAMARPG